MHLTAPAKINLYLHVTGRRGDGYHDLDSLVAFTDFGDDIILEVAPQFSFSINGPYAGGLQGENPENNLIIRAGRALAGLCQKSLDFKITLTKKLPVASGIGGGSSDAAAVLRGLAHYWQLPMDDPRLVRACDGLGQDVPVCLKSQTCTMTPSGVGAGVILPKTPILLVNPGMGLATPAVFKQFREGGYDFSAPAVFDVAPQDITDLAEGLRMRKNDLENPATDLMPDIQHILRALTDTQNCLLARMSGSGATCFGLYQTTEDRDRAMEKIRSKHPVWWVSGGILASS